MLYSEISVLSHYDLVSGILLEACLTALSRTYLWLKLHCCDCCGFVV